MDIIVQDGSVPDGYGSSVKFGPIYDHNSESVTFKAYGLRNLCKMSEIFM